MQRIRLLYRSPLAPAEVPLGHVCEVEESTAASLIADGSAEAVPEESPTKEGTGEDGEGEG